mgnify:CR=1 FL=1
MSDSLFKFNAIDSFPLPAADSTPILVTLDAANGTLVVNSPGNPIGTFSLIDNENEPLTRAIFIDTTMDPDAFQIGDVSFARDGLMVEHFPLNDSEISFGIAKLAGHIGILDIRDISRSTSSDHIGILDIRDVGRKRKVVYFFDMMPAVLSIEGNYLVVRTLRHQDSDAIGPWYIIT